VGSQQEKGHNWIEDVHMEGRTGNTIHTYAHPYASACARIRGCCHARKNHSHSLSTLTVSPFSTNAHTNAPRDTQILHTK
jgi:hypothetical protein